MINCTQFKDLKLVLQVSELTFIYPFDITSLQKTNALLSFDWFPVQIIRQLLT